MYDYTPLMEVCTLNLYYYYYYYFRTHKQGSALSVVLYFLVASGSEQFQIAAIFRDKDISKCSYNLFLVVE